MSSEYQIPPHQVSDLATEIAAAYHEQSRIDTVEVAFTPERTVSPVSEHLYRLASDIEYERSIVDSQTLAVQTPNNSPFSRFMRLFGVELKPLMKDFSQADLIARESQIGAEIVSGDVPDGETRIFFYEKDNNWFYVREFNDAKGKLEQAVVRFEVNDDFILQIIDGGQHQPIHPQDEQRLELIATEFAKRTMTEVYNHKSDYGLAS
jgi:hypothetical protein